MFKKQMFVGLSLLIALSMLLAACAPQTVEVIKTVEVDKEVVKTVETVKEVEKEVEVIKTVEVEKTAEPSTRTGAWVDMVVVIEEPSQDAAISRLEAGEIDLFAFTVANADLFKRVQESEALAYQQSYGSYNELTFNPSGPTFDATGKLNPFSNAKVREAMNWLIDRDYIANEVTGGMAIPRYFAFSPAFAEASRYADIVAQWQTYYAHNKDKAVAQITAAMEEMGATLTDGKWTYEGEPVVVSLLIRTEDERRLIGDYVASELESIGFTADRQYKTSAEASPIWTGDPTQGLWHIYTGGWISTAVPRSEQYNFGDFYTPDGWPGNPLWDAYVNGEEFYAVAMKLYYDEFTSLEERRALFEQVVPLSLQESQRVWTTNRASFTPYRAELSVTANLAGAVAGSALWPYTIRRVGEEGGAVTMAMPSILTNPWNPLNGSNWIYDQALSRATTDFGTITDPWTGLARPQRVEKAELTVQQDLPIGTSLDWVTLEKAETIVVPTDAWIDWDAENQVFLTVGDVYTSEVTALTKSVVYYPAEMFDVTWHDGSKMSVADFVMNLILTFDRGNEASAVYDPAAATALRTFKATFKGFKIVSESPFVFEYYSDGWSLDAENIVTSLWPAYAYGPGAWHSLSVGLLAEAAGETAFSQAKSNTLEKEWMSYISGPTLEILKTYLGQASADNYIPYAATLGQWVTADDATERWANYTEWNRARGHFWIGTGPFYLERAFPVEGMVVLRRNADFIDLSSKWGGYGDPKIAVVDVLAPASVTVGAAATFEVEVTFKGEPYASADVNEVQYLLFAADGSVVAKGTAESTGEGLYEVALTTEETGKLTAGSSKLLIVVVSNLVSVPSFGTAEFVATAP